MAVIYIVHENEKKSSPIIATGTRKDICEALSIGEYYFYRMNKEKSNLLSNQYYTEKIEKSIAKEKKKVEKAKTIPKKKSPYEQKIERIKQMLNIYGNTIIYKDHERIIKRLNKDGYSVKVTHEPERVIKSLSNSIDSEIYPECWLLSIDKKGSNDV